MDLPLSSLAFGPGLSHSKADLRSTATQQKALPGWEFIISVQEYKATSAKSVFESLVLLASPILLFLVLEAFSLQRSDWVIRLNISNFYEVDRVLHSSSINVP